MLRQALISVSRRARQGLQESLQGSSSQGATVRLERILSSSAVRAAEQQPAAAAQPTPGSPISGAAAAVAAAAPQAQGLSAAPGIARVLGFAGALPFLALSPYAATHLPLWLLDPSLITHSGLLQVTYGATILSFLGGVHWGVAMTNIGGVLGVKMAHERYLWSVLPCLMGWPTLLMPITQAAGVQAVLVGVVYSVDRSWAKRGLLPPWYMSLRAPLTLLAAGGLTMTAVLDVPPGILTGLASS